MAKMLKFGGEGLLDGETTWYDLKDGKRVQSKPGDIVDPKTVQNLSRPDKDIVQEFIDRKMASFITEPQAKIAAAD